ncbi:putative rho GTPase-activating protein 6 isoform X2 [Apostichopus japonicus]|uniref:Putative rho GTPase-activating protein 6 isoform X2 n=1 Tax=Stichopus japonicus TaxID=307972 RepID=A0A2G8KVC6_STIJA|nr:putative rho GTPase-activating protein 6 isoform X2 [Apostichopus japonicus]
MKASSNPSSSTSGKSEGDMKGGTESPDLTTSPPSSPSGLRRGKVTGAPSGSSRLMPRKLWKGKAYKPASPAGSYDILQPTWSPLGNGVWESTKGRRLQLSPKALIHLSDVERRHLKIVAQQKLQQLNLGPVNIPRDLSELKKKKGGLLKGGRNKATNFFDSWRESKDSKDNSPLIFGIPIEKCLQNDQDLRQIEAHKSRERRESLDLALSVGLQTRRKSSRSLHSPQLSRKSSDSSTALLEALSLSSTVNESHRRARRASLAPNADLKIPRVVSACFRFIEAYGLRTEGIFRVSGSKKRVRQIRESYDKGEVVIFTRDQSPHDVGALLKEYFRDLPEPLLTRDLYNIFTSLTKFDTFEEKLSTIRLGACLLPVVHRDVLFSLMKFLSKVADEAGKDHDSQGNEVGGNKMNAQNLGTLFGPNILKKTKGGLAPEKDKDLHADAVAHVERTRDVIITACFLIQHYKEIYQIPVSLQEEVLRAISETDPDALDFILNQRTTEMSFTGQPTQDEPPASTTNNFGISPTDTTSSSSGTFPCVIEDSSLASLSTIEDLVNENNFSDFDANIPSRGSSDSLDALEEEEDDTTVNSEDFTTIPVSNNFNHNSRRSGTAQAREWNGTETRNERNLSNGPIDGPGTLASRSPNLNRRENSLQGVDATVLDGTSADLVAPPHRPVKRGSIGLYAETMLALGIRPDPSEKTRSVDERQIADVNSNVTKAVNDPCFTCSKEREGYNYPRRSTSPSPPSYRDRSRDTQSPISSSSMSGSTSSSNASLVYVDAASSDVESKQKQLPDYDEVLKIKELGVKNYVTVNSSKYFVPVPHLKEDATPPDADGVQDHIAADSPSKLDFDKITCGDRSLPPYNKIRRRDYVVKDKHYQSLPPAYHTTHRTPQDPPRVPSPLTSRRAFPTSPPSFENVPSRESPITANMSVSRDGHYSPITSPLPSRRQVTAASPLVGHVPSRESPIPKNMSTPKEGRYSPVTSPLTSRRAVGITRGNRLREVTSPVLSRKTGVTSPRVTRKPLVQAPERRESPLLAWDHHDPTEMGTGPKEHSNKVASQVLLRDFPPKISLYHNWDFLDLNDEDGEFDGPETYV